ncbi:MAG TPA: LAGLIDADG family homing endonuclease, partial [Candidatus Saccharimonadales bacterium]|nr:LAGLIDADG family homing endonuclease [Candidatus Saccharimonadales bacterium]
MNDEYVPHVPHPPQQLFLTINAQEVLYGGAAGGGKLLNIDANVLTPKGWKRNGNLKRGDIVVDPRTGNSNSVLIAHPYQTVPVWEVEFEDGTVTEACADHLWTYRLSGKRTKGWDTRNYLGEGDRWLNGYKNGTTSDLADCVARARSQAKAGTRPNYPHIPVARAVNFTRPYRNINYTLPIDPYMLGLMLGDGWVTGNNWISVCSDDIEIHDAIKDYARISGFRYKRQIEKGRPATYWVDCYESYEHVTWLAEQDLKGKRSWEKFIPNDYLFAPLDYRYALVRGMMDTDGFVDDRGHMSYTTTSTQLAEDFTHLVRSLGAKAKTTSEIPSYTHKGEKKLGRRAYTIWFTPFEPHEFVSLTRKLSRIKVRQSIPAREVVDVRKTDRVETMRCITVDNIDGLYITDGFVTTHNSDALLMAALQYVDVPGYNALILRRTYKDLAQPEAIMDRAGKWLQGTSAQRKDGGKKWVFPSGATLNFGYLQNTADRDQYASAEYQFVAFDELTHFLEEEYTFLFSRMRAPSLKCIICHNKVVRRRSDGGSSYRHMNPNNIIKESGRKCVRAVPDHSMLEEYGPSAKDGMRIWQVPVRMRAASNPGARGHAWVKRRFINPVTRFPGAIFVPALLKDNPSIDEEDYNKKLDHLTTIDRERLKKGDWDVSIEGNMFRHHWWGAEVGLATIPTDASYARFWDLAATEGGGDYAAGALVAFKDGYAWIVDVVRGQWSPHQCEIMVKRTALKDEAFLGDANRVRVYFEQEPGSSGKALIDHYKRNILPG